MSDKSVWRQVFVPLPTPPKEPLPASGKAGRNLPAAFVSAIIMLGIAALGLFWNRIVLDAFIAVLILIALWEVAGAFARDKYYAQLPALYVGAIGMIVAASFGSVFWLAIALYLTFFLVVLWRFFFAPLINKTDSSPIQDIIISVFMAAYIPFTASFVILVSEASKNTPWPLMFFIVIVVCSDIGGWFAGILFGKHPLAPRISPKKTWEGLFGAVLLSGLAAWGATYLLEIDWWWLFLLCAAGSLVGTIGDLTESLIKRQVGLKDMSDIVPGHGGLMDRLDALLFAAPVFYIIYLAALG